MAKKFLKSHQIEDKYNGTTVCHLIISKMAQDNCHVYLTHPFVPSWSLVEAYCTNVPIITSDIKATREICGSGPYISYVNHRNKGFLLKGLLSLLQEVKSPSNGLRDSARFDVGSAVRAWGLVAGLNLTTTR